MRTDPRLNNSSVPFTNKSRSTIQFDDYANEIIDTSEQKATNAFGVLRGLSVTATSLALYKSNAWPNLSVPHFSKRMVYAQNLSQATLIALTPVVDKDERYNWEDYAFSHQEWVNDGLVLEGEDPPLNRIPYFIHDEPNGGLIPKKRRLSTLIFLKRKPSKALPSLWISTNARLSPRL